MKKPSSTENVILSILVLVGLVYQVVSILMRLLPLDENISARKALAGLTVSSGLCLGYIVLLMGRRLSRPWAWCIFVLIIATIIIINYLLGII